VQQVLDRVNAVELADHLLGHLLVIERGHFAMERDAAGFRVNGRRPAAEVRVLSQGRRDPLGERVHAKFTVSLVLSTDDYVQRLPIVVSIVGGSR